MTEKTKPALTAEEWKAQEVECRGIGLGVFSVSLDSSLWVYDGDEVIIPEEARHALAALALYGQPFGFTRDDAILVGHVGHYGGNSDWTLSEEQLDRLLVLAQKLAALLPPEETK